MLVDSVNVARPRPDPAKPTGQTGIDKRPVHGRVTVREPGPKGAGLGSALVGDTIGDGRHHGGHDQAVYAFAREDLDDWQARTSRELPNGFFGENLTVRGVDVNGALLGERWRIGEDVELQVSCPRIPCSTFRDWMGEAGWLKRFTRLARPGAYLSVITPGTVSAGDPIRIVRRPDHDVTITLAFRALTTERELLPQLLTAGNDLLDELRELATGRLTMQLDTDDPA